MKAWLALLAFSALAFGQISLPFPGPGMAAGGAAGCTISPGTLGPWTINQVISQQMTSSGGSCSGTWSVTAGALPTGLSISSGGLISGTISATGTFTPTISQGSTNQAYTITVNSSVTISRVSHTQSPSCPLGSSCSITIPSTGSGHLLVVMAAMYSAVQATISSVTGGCSGSWTSGSAGSYDLILGASGSGDGWYCLSSSSGTTSISATVLNGTFYNLWVAEYDPTNGHSFSFITAGTTNNPAATTSPTSAPVTMTGSTGLVTTVIVTDDFVSAGSSVSGTGWTTPVLDAGEFAFDDAINVASGFSTQGTFTSGSATYCSSSLAFQVN